MGEGRTFEDVLLVPQKTDVNHLPDVDTSSTVAGIELDVPVVSAPMDTVTEHELAQAMADNGGMGIIHRYLTVEEQQEHVDRVDGVVGAAVGLNEMERVDAVISSGADAVVFDIAHGHHDALIENISECREEYPGVPLMAGNVATRQGAEDLSEAGADAVKVGIGPGSVCTTREKTGVGVPQITAVQESSAVEADIIADGGIKSPGDMAKALMAGADAVMIGGLLSDHRESAGGDAYRGMASLEAAVERARRTDREVNEEDFIEEGVSTTVQNRDSSVAEFLEEYRGALQSAISYCGADTLPDARANAEFMEVSPSTRRRNSAHIHDRQ